MSKEGKGGAQKSPSFKQAFAFFEGLTKGQQSPVSTSHSKQGSGQLSQSSDSSGSSQGQQSPQSAASPAAKPASVMELTLKTSYFNINQDLYNPDKNGPIANLILNPRSKQKRIKAFAVAMPEQLESQLVETPRAAAARPAAMFIPESPTAATPIPTHPNLHQRSHTLDSFDTHSSIAAFRAQLLEQQKVRAASALKAIREAGVPSPSSAASASPASAASAPSPARVLPQIAESKEEIEASQPAASSRHHHTYSEATTKNEKSAVSSIAASFAERISREANAASPRRVEPNPEKAAQVRARLQKALSPKDLSPEGIKAAQAAGAGAKPFRG